MVLDFAARPPEINSGLMYAGAGAGPMMAASSAFNALSSELSSNAASYESVISQLTSEWQGPSSQAMAASAQPYIDWLTTTSGQLQEAATQAASSAAAYEAARSAMIPPPVIAADRAQLAALVATNILGQNTPAIAANEAMYGEFWAQDAAAMYGYAGASAAAATLSPLTPPIENTNPAGQGTQAAAVSNAVGSNGSSATLNSTLSGLQNAVSAAATPAANSAQASSGGVLSALNNLATTPIVENVIYNVGVTLAWNIAEMTATLPLLGHFMGGAAFGFTIGDATPLGAGLGFGTTLAGASSGGFGGGATLAGMGAASSVGGLSVPAGWSAATPAAVTDATLAGSGWTAAVDEGGTGMGGAPSGIMPGMASAAGKSGYGMAGPRYGVKPKVMPKQVFV
ncbi:PPE family protein [Candidatus Mycobacterium methanotrophicum]|uniref:PPE family protein n=1 Tax=Candidatus Mycobacterium methanotrophicum TaxID=2943498 RepID=A0ABY4QJG8_9MYCO|nr:PPE family protein [Candidatus Mycobacterium methanotrophicum]UQX10493.1 PPE family protein [Candidatus Mycobacterium methanotrophicum]